MTEGRSSRVITISSSLHHNATRPCSSASSSISTQNATGWRDRFPWRKIRSEPGIDLGDLNCEHKRYALFEQYAQTKLANVMFALELNRRESKFRLVRTTEQNEQVAKSRLGGGSHDNDNSDGDYVDDDPGRINDMVSPSDGGMRPISIGSDVNGKFSLTDESLESYPQVVSYCVHPGLVRTDFVRDMPWYLYYPHKIDYLVTGMLQKSPRSGAYTTVYCATLDTRMHCNNRNDSYFVNSELQPVARCALNEEDAAKLWKLSSNLVS